LTLIDFSTVLINSSSLLLIFIVIVYAWHKRDSSGALPLLIAAIFMGIWAAGSLAEIVSVDFNQKLFWRNITQIGAFYVPPSCLFFSVSYSGVFIRYKKQLLGGAYAMQTVGILLIFTDSWLHLMRTGVSLVQNGHYSVIAVQSTLLAKALISINFIQMAAALFLLIIFAVKTRNKMQKQVLMTLTGMAIAVVFSLLKVSSGESFMPFLPISGVFGLACLAMMLGITRYDFLMILPIARHEVFNVIGEGIVVAASQGVVIDANESAFRLLSQYNEQPIENNPKNLSLINTIIENHCSEWHKALSLCQSAEMDLWRSSNGENFYYHCNTYVLEKKGKKTLGTISVIRDVTEQHIQNDLLKYRAERDGLLGIYNRHTFIEMVGRQLLQDPGEACLLFFDIDNFKLVNDSFGHIAGDYVLKETCQCVSAMLDEHDLFGRIGGEEFAIFVSGIDRARAITTAEMLRRRIEAHSFGYQSQELHITVSIGIAEGSGLSFDILYQRADKMLYEAKTGGKNRVVMYPSTPAGTPR
jgi:diguanylate cyclase (GGDEF)-like protein